MKTESPNPVLVIDTSQLDQEDRDYARGCGTLLAQDLGYSGPVPLLVFKA